jgi:hypothetical protein
MQLGTIQKNKQGEIKTKLDGGLFKSVVSGGDEIDVRGMGENIYKMVNRTTLMFCANDFPEFYPIYSMKSFSYNNITQPNRNLLLYRDPNVDGMKTGHTASAGYNQIVD